MRRRRIVRAVVAAVGMLGTDRPVFSACNTIPPASRLYPSCFGKVGQRFVAPNKKVTVVAETGASFDPDAAKNQVVLVFPPGPEASQDTEVEISLKRVRKCVAGGCSVLRFAPSKAELDWALPPDKDGYTAVGPARIVVRRAGVVVAWIDTLFQPTDGTDLKPLSGCSQSLEESWPHPGNRPCFNGGRDPCRGGSETCQRFTVLPRPTEIEQGGGQPVSLVMALDLCGGLLLPLRHPKNVENGTGALFERGFGDFCARHKPWGLYCPAKFKRVLQEAERSPTLVRASTIEGHSLGPFLERDDDGGLLGLADSRLSVLQVERGTTAKKKDFDLRDYRFGCRQDGFNVVGCDRRGPVVVSGPGTDFGVNACDPRTQLAGLRATTGSLFRVDKDGKVWISLLKNELKPCGQDTNAEVSYVKLGGSTPQPVMEASASLAAFVDSGSRLRVFDANGKDNSPQGVTQVSLDPLVNGFPLAVEKRYVYFRDGNGMLNTFRPNMSTPEAIGGASSAAVVDAHVLYLNQNGAFVYNSEGGKTRQLTEVNTNPVKDARIANGGDLIVVAPPPFNQPPSNNAVAFRWRSGNNNIPGPNTGQDVGAAADELAIVQPRGCQTVVILATPGTFGRQLHVYDGTLTPTGLSDVSDIVTGDGMVAALGRSATSATPRLHVLQFTGSCKPVLLDTTAKAEGLQGSWWKLGWRAPFRIIGDNVFFLTQAGAGTEMLSVYNVKSQSLNGITRLTKETKNLAVVDTPMQGLGVLGEGLAIGDQDGDGVLDPFDNCQFTPNPRQVDSADADGLGDDACDPTPCTDYTPPTSLKFDLLRVPEVARATLAYLNARASPIPKCLGRIDPPRIADGDILCRGSIVGDFEIIPINLAKKVEAATSAFNSALDLVSIAATVSQLSLVPDEARRRIRLGYTASATAVSRLPRVWGMPGSAPQDVLRKREAALSGEVEAMQECLGNTTPSQCLGRIEKGKLIVPGFLEAPLQGLNSKVACAVWRNAVGAVMSTANDTALAKGP